MLVASVEGGCLGMDHTLSESEGIDKGQVQQLVAGTHMHARQFIPFHCVQLDCFD